MNITRCLITGCLLIAAAPLLAADTASGSFRRGVPQQSTTQTQVFDPSAAPKPTTNTPKNPRETVVTTETVAEKKTPPAPPLEQSGGRKTPPPPR